MKFKYKKDTYPTQEVINNDGDGEFFTIAPDSNGDYILLHCHSSHGVRWFDSLPSEDVKIIARNNECDL